MSKQLEKILVIRPGALGDTLMLLPSMCALTPKHKIWVAGRRPGIEFLSPYAEQCFDMEQGQWHTLFLRSRGGQALPPRGVEVVVCFITDRDCTISLNLRYCYPGARVYVFPSLPCGGDRVHVAQHVAMCLSIAGLALEPEAVLRVAREKPLLDECQCHPRNYIVLHPGSGSKRKNYSEAFWSRLINIISQLPAASTLRPLILLGPAEAEIWPRLASKLRFRGLHVVVSASSRDLLKIMRKARIFIGHDSGITHLAAMAGANTMAMFKASDPVLWRPLGPKVTVIKGAKNEDFLMGQVLDWLVSCQGA